VTDEHVPISDRPGTRLDHRITEKVYVYREGKRIHVGYFDPRNRVYQWGGDLSKHVYWIKRVMALGPEECAALRRLRPERLEFVDKGKTLYSLSIEEARKGEWYDGPAGRRFGIPLDWFEVSRMTAD
jgi:hypothetical protein